jgi:hypothetical protein
MSDAGKMEGEVSVVRCDGLKTGNKVLEFNCLRPGLAELKQGPLS